MAEEIRFDIVADFNTESLDSLTNYVSKARDEIVGMKKDLRDSMDGMDAPARLLAEQLDRCVATADQLAQKTTETSKAVRQDVMSEDTKREEAARINNMLADFNAMKTALTGDGVYSVTLAKQMLSGLPGAVQQEFSAIAPQVVSAMRRGFNSLNRGNQKITGTTADAMIQDAMDLTEIQSLLRGTSATQAQKESFVRSLLMNATQVQRTAEYQNARFGHTVKQASLPTRVEEILPELYKGAYANQGFVSGTSFAGKQNTAQGLSIAGTSKLLQLIQNNPVAARAAEASGLMHRNGAGGLTLDHGVTRGRLLDFSSSLWDEFHTRTRGLTNRFDDYYATSASEKERDAIEKRIVQRAYSGTGGTTLAAMQVVSDLLAQEQFTDKVGQVHRVIDPNTEAKRLKEQYTVEKLTPFSPVDPTGSKKVTLAESQMTRMLGMQGRNYQDLDAVKLISLAGYDASNPEHVQRLRELQEQGYTGSQGHYSVHAMHGTGENTVLRMIRDQERQAITARYTPFAQQLGLAGTDVFNAFVPTNMEFKDPAALGKHMEQLNKMWTDSYVLGSDISGKKFAFVDFSQDKDHQFSDGLGFMGKGILPGAIQARFGLSGKGSFYEMGTETVGEWAKNAGRLDDQGRYMVKGIDGTMFDASQYHGLIDISQMKNLAAYNGLNNAQANTALTAMLREFPIAAVADYNYDGDAAGLGPQMMTFLAMSPAMQQHQATNVAQRLRDLQTLEGQRRYVFNNPESDIVSRMANDPVHGDEFMLSDPRVKDRVDTYVDSLMRRSASGEFINFNDIANIQNERLLRSPIVADFMTRGGMTDAEVAHYQDIFQKVHGREFTPEEVRKYMMLEGGVADFGHEDASQVAALRSPTGFGQLLVRENYASMLRPVLEYLGETPTGFHANNEDYKTLAGADMDADEVKAIADKANKLGPDKSQLSLVSELAKVKEIADSYGISAKEAEVLTHALPALAGGNNIGNAENWLRMAALSIKAPMEMGVYSDVGSRLAGNLDLFDQTMRSAAVIATKANNGYDPATTLNKKPAEIEHDKQVYAALRLGQEYQKIPAHIKDVYNVDSHYDEKSDSTYYTTKDGETLIDPKDVFKTSNGRLMNLSYFRGMDGTRLDKTNLPSVLSTPMLGAMLGAKINSELGLADSTLTTDLLEAFGVKEVEGPKVGEGVSFNGAGEATKALMANKRAMLAQFIGQQRFSISDQERDVLASQYAASMEEIEKEAASKLEQGGVIKDENGKYVGRQQYVSTQARKFGLDQVALMLGMYKGPDGQLLNTGLTQSNIEAKYGANFAQALQNGAGVTLPYMTPAVFSPEYQRYATYYNRGQVGAQHVASAQAPVVQQPEQQRQQQQAAQNPPTPPTTPPGGNNPPNNNPTAGSREDMQEWLRGESAIEAAQNIIEDARKFKSSMSKERYSDRELTAAQKWYGSNKGYLQYLQNAYDEFDQKGHSAIAGNSAIAIQVKNAIADAQYEFVEARDTHARKAMTDSTERLDRLINGRGTEADAQLEKVAKWDEVIDGVISERSEYLKSLGNIEDKMSGKNGQSRSDNRLQEFDQQIDMLQERRDQGFENLIKENAQMFEDVTASFDKMIEGKDRSPQAKIQRTLEKARTDLTQKDQTLDDFYNKGLLKKEDYDRIKADYAARFGKLDDGTYQAQLESYLNVNQELSQLQHDVQLNQFMRQGSIMSRNMYGHDRGIIGRALAHREQALTSWQNRKVAAEKQLAAETKARDKIDKDKDPEAYAKATDNINALQQASDQASSAIEKLSDPMATAASVAAQFGDVVGRLATRLGRQLFRKALNEAKKFVQEFDKSMTTIQMITLKSDSQMSTLGDGLIAKAKELKISISEITQSAETLYRQGLSDEEVNERLDIISKFSKVSGTKVDAATKLITVAMNTGLVTDPQIAADIVTALGDNAATNASEIEKGIEKAGAAAAADGTTFAQLASMLTAITSTTQIGGNVAGRTLNTIFGRMNKIGTNELIYDENGNAVSGSAVAKLLAAQGVRTYDEQGNKRSSYDVLYDLSQKWDSLEDATQQQLATQIAGTRQYSNFSAIMQGMSEGKVSEYMSLAASAEGITDQKYDIYTKSLQASLTDLKNTFDALVQDLVDKGYVQDFIEGITTMINGVDNLVNSLGGLQMALPVVMTMLGAISGLKFGGIGALIGALAGLGTYAGLTALGSTSTELTQEQIQEKNVAYQREQTVAAKSNLAKAQSMYETYKNGGLSEADQETFNKLLSEIDSSLAGSFSEAERAALGLSGTFENVGKQLDAYATALEAKSKQEDYQQFRNKNSGNMSDVVVSRYASGDGRTYTEEQQFFRDYITENYSDDGFLGWSHNGLDDYMRDIVTRGVNSEGETTPGYFLNAYKDRIDQWVKEGQFVQYWKRENGETVPVAYTNTQDLFRDFATGNFTDRNGVGNDNDRNLQTLFNLMMGINGVEENLESQAEFAQGVVSSTYGDRLQQSLNSFDYIDENLAKLVKEAFVGNVMQGVQGEIYEASAIGGEADIPGRISSESERLLSDMYSFFNAEDPVEAFKDYVVSYKKNDTAFLEEHAEELKGLNDEGMNTVIRKILFPTTPTLAEEEAEEIAKDVLHAGSATGYATWSQDKSNAYGLAADAMIRNLQTAGVTDMASLQAYLQTTNGQEWKYLTQNNGDLARLVSSVQYDAEGNIINPDVYDQIINTLYANSKYNGARFVSTQEKAKQAQGMLSSITSGETGYLSWEDALAAAEIEEQAAIDAYEAEVAAQVQKMREEYQNTLSPEDLEKGLAAWETNYRATNPYVSQTSEQRAAGYRVYSDTEKAYLKEALGEELYQKVVDKKATQEEQDYANLLLSNRGYGLTALTSRQQYNWLTTNKSRLSTLGQEGGLSRTVADAYMSQWSGWPEYAALLEKKNTTGLSPEEQQQFDDLTQSLENFEQQSKIKIDIEGVQALEEAGKVADGTAAKLEKLQKGGHVAIEVETSLQTEAFEQAQQNAKLNNGTIFEQDEAAMSILGMSREQYYANRDSNYALAQIVQNSKNVINGNTLAELYNAEGLSDEQRAAIDAAAHAAGYRVTENDIYYDDTGRHSTRGYAYAGNTELTNINPLVGEARSYSDNEKNRMLEQILAGEVTRTVGEGGNSELYDAAISSAGTYTRELLRRKANGENIDNWLQIASDNERSAYQLQMLTGTSTKMTQAQQAQWAINNFSNPDSAGYLASFLNMNETDIKRLMSFDSGKAELQAKFEETQKAMYSEMAESLGIELDTSDMSSMKDQIQTAADNAEGLLKEFLLWIAGTIDEAGNVVGSAGNKSFADIIAEQQKATREADLAMAEAGKIIESKDYSQLKENTSVNWSSLNQQLLYMMNDRANNANSIFTDEMINDTYLNALYGRSSSPVNQQKIMESLFGGNMSAENMISTYQGWMKDKEGHAAEIEAFNSLDNVDDITEAMTSQENAIEKTTQAVKEYNQQVEVSQTNYMKKYGERTAEVASKVENLRKSEKSATAELKNMTSTMSSLANNQYYRQQWMNGDRSSKTKENVATQLGLSDKKDLEAFSDEEITTRLKRLEISDIEDIQVDANAISESMSLSINEALGGQKLTLNGMEVNVDSGSVSLSWDDALSQLSGLLSQEEADFIAMLKAYHIEGTVVVNDTGNGLETHIEITGLGSGRSGGGGGGGGGKSASEKLVDKWKHRVTAQEHEVTMAGIQAQDAALANDGGSYIAAIDKQIEENEKLRKVYEEELEALKAQLSTVTEGSDDWWILKEAIQSAEEAQAQLNKTIADLETSKINEIVEAYEYLASLSSHQTNLADSANRTARQDLDYEGWTQSIQDKVSARRSQTAAAQQSLADLQALYAAYLAGGGSEDDDTARSYIQQMNELEEVIASESADIRDLLSEQLEVARTQRDTELIIPDYYSTMLGYIVQKLDTENNATGQLAAIEAKKKTLQDRRDVYTGSNELLQQQLAEEYEAHGYSQHYYEILQEIYSNLENIAGIEQEISELTSQRLAVITEYFDNILNQNTHDKNMLQTQQTLLDYYNDYSGRKTNAQAQRDNIAERRTTLQHELNALTAEQANYAEGDENWIATRDKINAIKEELYGLLNDENSLNTEIFNAAKENFDNMMKPFTHADNMYAIDSERYGRLNDYENQNAVIDYQLINNGNKADVYKKTIEEMKALRAGVEEGSDAWWNYTNAINEAEESLAKLDNEAAKLRAQKLTNLLEKQANEDKTGSHAYNMLGLTASRAMLQEDYDAYYQAQEDKLYNIKDTIDQNKSQVSELEGLLAQFEIGSDEWLKTRDEIWKIKKETAQKENEAIQIEQEIAKQRLAQITQELNRNTKYFSHSNTMTQSYGAVYQRYGNYTGYRSSLDKQAENWQAIQAENKKAREQTLAEMAELEIGTAEWYNARDAVYAYDEALLRTEVELENLEKARNLSFLQEVQNQFDDATRNLNYQLTAVRAMKTKASNNNSYENYKEYANMEKTLLQQQIASRNDYIESQKELMSQFTKETEEWKQAKQNIINAMSQNIADQTSIDQIDIDLAKSWVDKLFDVMDWADSETEHNLNLVQYEQTRYQNGNELTNYGIMLQKENEIRQDAIKRREEEIKQLKQEQAQLEENSTEYNRITEKIKAKEEAVQADTVAIEQNNKKLKENEVAIRQTRKELEDIVEKELKAEKERQKKMLDSEISLQKTILDTIKQTYKDKWDLEKTDIKKQKEALQEYKQTLNDRLAARKNALDMEEKYRQLEEYQQQLTLISADPTRTKDAKTLREQIRSLEKDIAWDKASKEVEAEADAIDQAIESLDDYVTVHEEDLEALLADSRNFAEDVNLILQGSFESIVDWLAQNNTEFKNALDENREQMVQGWEQTWKDMYGIVDTYWDQIDEILSSYENFIDFMMQTPDYLNASVTQQWLILQDLADKYDAFAKSAIESIEAVNYALHEHEQQQGSDEETNPLGDLDLGWLDDIGEEAPDWTQSNEPPEVQTYTGVGQTDVEHIVTPGNIETDDTYDDVGIAQTHEDYHPDYTSDSTPDEQVTPADVWQLPEADDSGFGDFVFPTAEDVQSALDDIENPHLTYDVVRKCSALFNSLGKTLYATTVDKGSTPVYVGDTPTKPEDSSYTYAFSGWSPAVGPIETDTTYTAQFTATAKPQEDSDTDTPTTGGNGGKKWHATVSAEDPTGGYTKSATGTGSSKDAAASAARQKLPLNNPRWIETGVTYDYYKHGGLVDYTGPAWVDGTPTEPEAFLSAYDTKSIRALADALNYVFVSPGVLPGSENFGNNNSYGDIYITINQAELKDDADFEEVARRIGNAFTKQMSKQGFNMNGYSF